MKCSGWHSVNGSLAQSREEFPLHCFVLWVIFPLASLGDISALQPVGGVKEITPSCEGDSPLGSNIPELQPWAWHPETLTCSPLSLLPPLPPAPGARAQIHCAFAWQHSQPCTGSGCRGCGGHKQKCPVNAQGQRGTAALLPWGGSSICWHPQSWDTLEKHLTDVLHSSHSWQITKLRQC